MSGGMGKEEEEKTVAGRSNLEKKSEEQHAQMYKQMRSGRGSGDREEGVEHNYMITSNIFATEEVTITLVIQCPANHAIIAQ